MSIDAISQHDTNKVKIMMFTFDNAALDLNLFTSDGSGGCYFHFILTQKLNN